MSAINTIPMWAEKAGLAEDGRSLATARRLLKSGEGPKIVCVNGREGISLRDHAKWQRSQPWAKYLAESAAAEREKRERRSKHGRSK
jgi:hypothetical protein